VYTKNTDQKKPQLLDLQKIAALLKIYFTDFVINSR